MVTIINNFAYFKGRQSILDISLYFCTFEYKTGKPQKEGISSFENGM